MPDIAIARANILYMNNLRKRGYPTPIHALPERCQNEINTWLIEGNNDLMVANRIAERFSTDVEKSGLKPISHLSVKTYRTKYWANAPQTVSLAVQKTPELQNKLQKVSEKVNALGELIKLAVTQTKKAKMVDEKENMVKVPMQIGNDTRTKAFEMWKQVVELQQRLGLLPKDVLPADGLPLTEGSDTSQVPVTSEEFYKRIVNVYEAINKTGKYAGSPYIDGQIVEQGGANPTS